MGPSLNSRLGEGGVQCDGAWSDVSKAQATANVQSWPRQTFLAGRSVAYRKGKIGVS